MKPNPISNPNNEDATVFSAEGNAYAEELKRTVKATAAKSSKQNKTNSWRKVAIGGTTGILLGGGAAAAATGFMSGEHDGDLQMATDVDDSQSFGEAFQTARAEVGPDGAFVWHGNVYTTHTTEEWNAMTPEQREHYSEVVSGENYQDNAATSTHHQAGDVGEHHESSHDVQNNQQEHQQQTGHTQDEHQQTTHTQDGHQQQTTHTQEEHSTNEDASGTDVVSHDSDPQDAEIQLIGTADVTLEDGTEVTVGQTIVGDREVYVVDVDKDDVFDVAMSDFNDDGTITQDEMFDISDAHLTVQDFPDGGDMGTQEYLAQQEPSSDNLSSDVPDYVDDASILG